MTDRRFVVSSTTASRHVARPRTTFRLALRIYLIALLPIIATNLIIGVLDLSRGGSARGGYDLLVPLGLLLLLFAVGAVLFARSLARPITRLAQTAAAFGAGNLEARTGLKRKDELGELARVFDEMAERLSYLMQAQKRLLANVSHELSTPLARIRVALDIVEGAEVTGFEEEIEGIGEDLKELEQLVANILMTARLDLESGRAGQPSLPLQLQQVASRPIIDAAMERFRRKSPSRSVDLDIDDSLPMIEADRVLVRRVINNLLDNARKYSDADSVVALRARRVEQALQVEVEDHGIGMSEADLEKIFTPFFRTDRSRNRATGGVGLGLSLSRQIIEAHGGSIEIESEKDRGTIVRFSLPAQG